MDEALLNALNDLSDDLGLMRLDEVLDHPDRHTYAPGGLTPSNPSTP